MVWLHMFLRSKHSFSLVYWPHIYLPVVFYMACMYVLRPSTMHLPLAANTLRHDLQWLSVLHIHAIENIVVAY